HARPAQPGCQSAPGEGAAALHAQGRAAVPKKDVRQEIRGGPISSEGSGPRGGGGSSDSSGSGRIQAAAPASSGSSSDSSRDRGTAGRVVMCTFAPTPSSSEKR